MASENGRNFESTSLYDTVLEALPDGVLVYDAKGRCRFANHRAARLLDLPFAQLREMGWGALRLEERSDLEQKIARTLGEGVSAAWEGAFSSGDGKTRWLRLRLEVFRNQGGPRLLIIMTDVSERRRSESVLRLTQASVDRCADPIYWVSPEGRILFVNDAGCRRYGYTKEEMLGLTLFHIVPEMTPELWQERWENIKRFKSLPLETYHMTKAGEVFPVEVRANYVAHEGREYSVSFVRDITERRRQEQELMEAHRALEVANDMLRRAVRRASRLNQQLRAAHKILEQQASTDALTGALNRRAILERLREELARSERTGVPCGLGLIDLDHFKRLNDTYGHLAGDEALQAIAERIARTLRPYDVIGRFGGEEFVVLMPGADAQEVRAILERVRRAVSECPVEAEGFRLSLTVSAGGVSGRRGPAEDLIRTADHALYEAKRTRRNRVVVVDEVVPAAEASGSPGTGGPSGAASAGPEGQAVRSA